MSPLYIYFILTSYLSADFVDCICKLYLESISHDFYCYHFVSCLDCRNSKKASILPLLLSIYCLNNYRNIYKPCNGWSFHLKCKPQHLASPPWPYLFGPLLSLLFHTPLSPTPTTPHRHTEPSHTSRLLSPQIHQT